jgi:hypothetical protein
MCEVELEWSCWHALFGKRIGCHRDSLRVGWHCAPGVHLPGALAFFPGFWTFHQRRAAIPADNSLTGKPLV